MCQSEYPPNFFGKKTVRIKIRYLALKNSLFLVSTRNDNISRGCAKKMEFPEGRGVHFVRPILENPEGRGIVGNSFPEGRYGYFLELHILVIYKQPIFNFGYLANNHFFNFGYL